MIIRRRTYVKQFTSKYGYFMRNVTFGNGVLATYNSSDSEWEENDIVKDALCNVYTKCMQKETPVGQFPNSIRNDSTNWTCNTNTNRVVCAIGCTNGVTIVVAAGKKLYRSNDGGNTWGSPLCTWNNNSYISRNMGPVVWIDSSYYYVLYVSIDAAGGTNTYYRLKLFKYSISDGSTSTTTLQSQYYSGGVRGPYSTNYGEFYANKVSPKGQVMIYSNNTASSYSWILVDLPRGKISGEITCPVTDNVQTNWQGTGQWYNDGTTYGSFFAYLAIPDYNNQGTVSCYRYVYYKITASAFNSGGSITKTDITNTLGRIVTDNYTYWPEGSPLGSGIYQYPNVLVCSCDQSYKNKLFIVGGKNVYYYDMNMYVCKADFSDIEQLPALPSNWKWEATGTDDPGDIELGGTSGNCVSPDGMYGCILLGSSVITYDIINKVYWGAYSISMRNEDGILITGGNQVSYMLPKSTL